MDQINAPLYITFGLYLAAVIALGVIAWWRTKTFDDYILGGRSLGPWVVALAAGASDMSGWLLMGLPGAVFEGGVSSGWLAFGLVAGAWINWRYVAGPLRVYTERADNALTIPDYFTGRFHDESRLLRVLSAVVILVFFAVYCASGVVAGARLFETVFPGIGYTQALFWGAGATILYTLIGGFLAVSWTDTLQATLMFFALLLAPSIVVMNNGGFEATVDVVRAFDASRLDWFDGGALGFIGIISLLAWGLGYFGQPHILARFMAADTIHTIKPARRIGMTWMIACLAGAIGVGFFGIAYFANHPEAAPPVLGNAELVFIELAKGLFNPWVAGILLSAILAAVMSTLSCQLLVCSSVMTEDFYRGFLRPKASQRELVWIGRVSVALIALLALWLARDPDSRVLGLVSYAWAGFGAAFGPVVLLSLFWERMTRNGALAGIVVGATTVIAWKLVAVERFGSELYEMVPGFIAATIAIVLVSRLGAPPPQSIRALHQQVRASLRETGY
jgi:sodium/proline symporter